MAVGTTAIQMTTRSNAAKTPLSIRWVLSSGRMRASSDHHERTSHGSLRQCLLKEPRSHGPCSQRAMGSPDQKSSQTKLERWDQPL